MCTKAQTYRTLRFGGLMALAVCGAAFTQAASAQPYGPQQNLDDRFRNQVYHLSPEQRANDALMSGQGDLMLLRPTRLVTAHAGYARSSTDNVTLSPDDPRKGSLGVADAGLHVGTVIGGRVEVYADANVVMAGYAQTPDLDYSAVTCAIGAATHVAGVDINVAYMPSAVFNANFRDRQLTQNRVSAEVSTTWKLGRLAIQPALIYDRTRANPTDYDNTATAARLTLALPFKTQRPLMIYLSAGYEERLYDHYFPDLLGVTRRDRLSDVAVGARWTIAPAIDLSAQYGWQLNRSSSDVNGYRAGSGNIGLSLHGRF